MKIPQVIVIVVLVVGQCRGKGMQPSYFTINMEDILSERLMPATFLMLEGPTEVDLGVESRTATAAAADSEDFGLANVTREDGSFGTAFSTMGFHRKMINSYLCNGFLAGQIMSEVMPARTPSVTRRVGTSLMITDNGNFSSKDTMLYDQGSSGYMNWLSKSSTLEDIYRNYLSPPGSINSSDFSNHRSDTSSNPRSPTEDEYFDEGVITGYAVHHPDPAQPPHRPPYPYNPYNQHPRPHHHHHPQVATSKHHMAATDPLLEGEAFPYESSRGDYSYHPVEIDHHPVGKGLGLKDLFDIALTTLAFLSFGMFVLQVIMCITMTKTDANMMMVPVTPGGDGGEEEVRRMRRSPGGGGGSLLEGPRLREINEIARRVLDSMDAAVLARGEGGDPGCVQKVICESNRFSKELKYTRRYWMAVWNLGISWLAGSMVEPETSSGTILGCLRAMAIGLGGGNCDRMYVCGKESKPKRAKT